MTWMRPRERYGTRYLGMSPRGGIAEPPWLHYSESGAGCQCARWPCGPNTKTSSFLSRIFYWLRNRATGLDGLHAAAMEGNGRLLHFAYDDFAIYHLRE